MQYLFEHWTSLEKRILRAKHILLCADFDGTITPVRPRPADAELSQQLRTLLRSLSKKDAFFVGIISGRSLAELRRKVGIKELIFAGNHGLEIVYNNKKFVYPTAKRFIPLISAIARNLNRRLGPFPGAILEEKRLSLSLHYRLIKNRNLARLRAVFLQTVRPYLAARKLRLTHGKKVWDLRPALDWDKGRAVIWLVRKLKAKNMLTLYIGDDLTDEDGFRAVNKIGGISILVGKKRHSAARYYLKGTKDTEEFLNRLCAR